MAQLKNMYYARYHKNLESVIRGDVSGYFEKLLMICIQVKKGETWRVFFPLENRVDKFGVFVHMDSLLSVICCSSLYSFSFCVFLTLPLFLF